MNNSRSQKRKRANKNSIIISAKKNIEKRIKKSIEFPPLLLKSKTRFNKRYELDEKSTFYSRVKGFDRSSAAMKLFTLFTLYQQRLESKTNGYSLVKDVGIFFTKDEADDLFSALRLPIETKSKIGKKRVYPYYEGRIFTTTVKIKDPQELMSFFSMFKNIKPKIEYYCTYGSDYSTPITNQEYIQILKEEKECDELFGCSLTVGKKVGMKNYFKITYVEVPSLNGGNLNLHFWYEIENTCPPKRGMITSSNHNEKKYTDEEIGFTPLTSENFEYDESQEIIPKHVALFIENAINRQEAIKIFQLTQTAKMSNNK